MVFCDEDLFDLNKSFCESNEFRIEEEQKDSNESHVEDEQKSSNESHIEDEQKSSRKSHAKKQAPFEESQIQKEQSDLIKSQAQEERAEDSSLQPAMPIPPRNSITLSNVKKPTLRFLFQLSATHPQFHHVIYSEREDLVDIFFSNLSQSYISTFLLLPSNLQQEFEQVSLQIQPFATLIENTLETIDCSSLFILSQLPTLSQFHPLIISLITKKGTPEFLLRFHQLSSISRFIQLLNYSTSDANSSDSEMQTLLQNCDYFSSLPVNFLRENFANTTPSSNDRFFQKICNNSTLSLQERMKTKSLFAENKYDALLAENYPRYNTLTSNKYSIVLVVLGSVQLAVLAFLWIKTVRFLKNKSK